MAEEKKQEGCPSEGCAGCSHASTCTSQMKDFRKPANPYSAVRKVIGVISGKGGVGKSMVTASLARMMIEKGYTAGILDADITGPSIPKMYGIHEQALGNEEGMLPCVAKDGTKIMSVNLLLEKEDTPVIWRGPIIAGVVTQFWTDVMWGDVDYLFVKIVHKRVLSCKAKCHKFIAFFRRCNTCILFKFILPVACNHRQNMHC